MSSLKRRSFLHFLGIGVAATPFTFRSKLVAATTTATLDRQGRDWKAILRGKWNKVNTLHATIRISYSYVDPRSRHVDEIGWFEEGSGEIFLERDRYKVAFRHGDITVVQESDGTVYRSTVIEGSAPGKVMQDGPVQDDHRPHVVLDFLLPTPGPEPAKYVGIAQQSGEDRIVLAQGETNYWVSPALEAVVLLEKHAVLTSRKVSTTQYRNHDQVLPGLFMPRNVIVTTYGLEDRVTKEVTISVDDIVMNAALPPQTFGLR